MYKTGFQTIAEWIIKTDTFLSHEELLSLVFKASKTKWFPEVKNILWNLITKSSNWKLFENVSFSQAFKNISSQEQKFLDSVVDLILTGKENFENEIDDAESDFWNELSDLLCDLLTNFEILLFQNIEQAK